MPLDRLVLILACVVIAAGGTVWLALLIGSAVALPFPAIILLIPVALVVYVIARVILDRVKNTEDDHYDTIEK